MSDEKFTPGPWRRSVATISGKNSVGATVYVAKVSPEPGLAVRDANCRLIQAAPDAHEILLVVYECFRHDNPVDPWVLILPDGRTIGQAVADYVAKTTGN